MKFLIDADTYIYKLAYFNKNETDLNIIKKNTIIYMNGVFKKLEQYGDIKNYLLLLTSTSNYRTKLTSTYKAHRPKKPQWVKEIYEIIRDNYQTITIRDYEADDLAAILMKKSNYKDIIVHSDKDLLQIPGTHIYRNKMIYIDHVEAYLFLMKQTLMGDVGVDNIKGVPGIGKVTAEKLLKNQPLIDMENIVIKSYIQYYKDEDIGLKQFWLNYNLIKLKTDIDV